MFAGMCVCVHACTYIRAWVCHHCLSGHVVHISEVLGLSQILGSALGFSSDVLLPAHDDAETEAHLLGREFRTT